MKNSPAAPRESWNGLLGFIMAGVGSAVGLGNIWKFPYITGLNGGGAFVLIYLLCIIVVGLPLMLCEISIGRATQKNPFGAFRQLHPKVTAIAYIFGSCMAAVALALLALGRYGMGLLLLFAALGILRWGWSAAGAMAVIIPTLILSYYNVVGGWTFIYAMESLRGSVDFTNPEAVNNFFGVVAGSWKYSLYGMLIFAFAALAVVWFGIRAGIERVSKVLMPLLFIMLIALIIRAVTLPGAEAGVSFLLTPNFNNLTAAGVLEALGHAFYTLSLGMGIVITYGSYLSRDRNILGASCWIVALDTMVALMAGLAIFPALFACGIEPTSGPGLVFKIMPITLNSFGDGLGQLWCFLFFGLLAIAAVTSSISLLEVPVSFCIDQWKWPRRFAVLVCFSVITCLGILSSISITSWHRITWLYDKLVLMVGESHMETNFFDQLDVFCSNYLLPMSGLLSVLFVAYIWKTRNCLNELRRGADGMWDVNIFILLAGLRGDAHMQDRKYIYTIGVMFGLFIRIFAPLAIVLCFMKAIGWINLG